MSEEDKPEVPGIPSNLLSEFFVQVVGRIIPGSLFACLFFIHETPTEGVYAFGFIFLCVAWFIGSASDLASQVVLVLLLKLIRKLAESRLGQKNKLVKCLIRYDSHRDFVLDREDKKRIIAWYVYEAVFFRCMGVLFLAVIFCPPSNWPIDIFGLPYYHAAPLLHLSAFPWLCWGKICGVVGFGICVVCWIKIQFALQHEKIKHFLRRFKKRQAPF